MTQVNKNSDMFGDNIRTTLELVEFSGAAILLTNIYNSMELINENIKILSDSMEEIMDDIDRIEKKIDKVKDSQNNIETVMTNINTYSNLSDIPIEKIQKKKKRQFRKLM